MQASMSSPNPKNVFFYLLLIPFAAIPWLLILFLLYHGQIAPAIIGAFAFIFFLPWLPGLLKGLSDELQGKGDDSS